MKWVGGLSEAQNGDFDLDPKGIKKTKKTNTKF